MTSTILWPAIADWNQVYDNTPNIPQGDAWPARWVAPARDMRETLETAGRARLGLKYGPGPRQRLDLFLPEGAPKGLVVFVHGGFWMGLDESYWSHLAAGPLARGFAVAMPTYTLAPEARLSDMTREIARAVAFAADQVPGPVRLAGHSAGGHLVTRMAVEGGPLDPAVQARLARVVSLSGLHDLRPMLKIWRNEALKLDLDEAIAESAALQTPVPGLSLVCWAGAMETSEFLRQNALLANIWRGLGASTACVEEPMRHHFNVIDGLADPDHPLCEALCG